MSKIFGGVVAIILILSLVINPGYVAKGEDLTNQLPPQITEELSKLSPYERELAEKYFAANLSLGQLNDTEAIRICKVLTSQKSTFRKPFLELVVNMVPLEEVLFFEFPPGIDIEEYVKGRKENKYKMGLAGPITGHYGAFVAGIIPPLLPLMDVMTGLGVRGGKLEVAVRDTRSDIAIGLSCLEEFKAMKPRPNLVVFYGPEEGIVISPLIKEAGLFEVTIGAVDVSVNYKTENVWSIMPIQEENVMDELWYGIMEWPKETGNPPPTKWGTILVNIYAYEDGVKWYSGSDFIKQLDNEYGLKFVGVEKMDLRAIDATPQLLKLREKGAQWIHSASTTSSTAVIAKCAAGLGMNKEPYHFFSWHFGYERSAMELAGPENVEGWMAPFCSYSFDTQYGRDHGMANALKFMEGVGTKPAPGEMGQGVIALMKPFLIMFVDTLDTVGGWSHYDEITPDVMQRQMAKLNCSWFNICPANPTTYLPGKTSNQVNGFCVTRSGKAVEVMHRDGNYWGWVPPNIIPDDGPCPPQGWQPPPLEGSIDYGPIWGVWTFDEFLATYDVPLKWAVFQYAFGADNRLDKDLLFKTFDRYFEAKKVVYDYEGERCFNSVDWSSPEKRVEKLTEFVEQYYLPDNWVEWINEYIDNQKSKIGS